VDSHRNTRQGERKGENFSPSIPLQERGVPVAGSFRKAHPGIIAKAEKRQEKKLCRCQKGISQLTVKGLGREELWN